MTCYTYARSTREEVFSPLNGVKRLQIPRLKKSFECFPYNTIKKPNRAKRHRLNPGRRHGV